MEKGKIRYDRKNHSTSSSSRVVFSWEEMVFNMGVVWSVRYASIGRQLYYASGKKDLRLVRPYYNRAPCDDVLFIPDC